MSTNTLNDQFYELTPTQVMEAIENSGYPVTGEYFQLNSYENRVFDIFLEPEENDETLKGHLITKFYRPQRWSKNSLLEEHSFLEELKKNGFPCISPLKFHQQNSLNHFNGIYFTLFPKGLGRMPQELTLKDLELVGQSLAQLHNIGAQKKANHRPYLTMEEVGDPSLKVLERWVAPEVWSRYQSAAEEIFDFLDEFLNPHEFIRIHGDCHRGNLIQYEYSLNENWVKNYFFVDFDDFLMGPAAQDFWMLFSDETDYQIELNAILRGYEKFREFPKNQLQLFEGLRALRIIRYGAWIASRWKDPTFPQLFPQFIEYNYWAEEVDTLERLVRQL